MVNFMI